MVTFDCDGSLCVYCGVGCYLAGCQCSHLKDEIVFVKPDKRCSSFGILGC